jgi:bla regulator protein blaR1
MISSTSLNALLYTIQIFLVIGLAALGNATVPRARARVRLVYWRGIVLVCLALPLLQAFRPFRTAAATQIIVNMASTVGPLTSRAEGLSFDLIIAVWLAGVTLRIAYLTLGVWRLRALRRSSVPLTLNDAVEGVLRTFAPTAVIHSHAAFDQPVTFGFKRPMIVLPPKVADLSIDLQRGIVAHEALHVARHDWLHVLAEQLVGTLFWFHPAMWWALDQVQLAREQWIDEIVVTTTGGRKVYMAALLAFSDPVPGTPFAPSFLRRRHLVRRIRALSRLGVPSPLASRFGALALFAIAAGATLSAASLVPVPGQKPNETVYEPGNGVTLPSVIREVRPSHTEAAKEARIEGTVLLQCVVMSDGTTANIVVTQSLDQVYGLDAAAVDALKQWRFKPGTKDGKPVAVRVHIEMTFTLK